MKKLFDTLTKDGAVLYGLANTLVAARAGITSKGFVWVQIGDSPLLLLPLTDWREEGCGLAATGQNGERLYLVAPADADDMQLGAVLDTITANRDLMTEADCLALLGDEA